MWPDCDLYLVFYGQWLLICILLRSAVGMSELSIVNLSGLHQKILRVSVCVFWMILVFSLRSVFLAERICCTVGYIIHRTNKVLSEDLPFFCFPALAVVSQCLSFFFHFLSVCVYFFLPFSVCMCVFLPSNLTPPRNREGVIFSLHFVYVCVCVCLCVFVCLSVCHWTKFQQNEWTDLDAVFAKWLLTALAQTLGHSNVISIFLYFKFYGTYKLYTW